jgi:serine/threonine-protein kinase
MTNSDQSFFAKIILELHYASPDQIEQCTRLQSAEVEVGKSRRPLGQIMLEMGFLTSKQLETAQAEQRRVLKEIVVGPYRILDKLGQGGMGAVYRATVPDTGVEVALKLLPKELSNDPNFLARFRREANIGMELHHPHIVRTVDFGESKGVFYLAMEIVEGGTLDQHLQVQHTIPERTALKIVRDLLGALQYAHEKGLVHRDIKPSNILFDREGKSKLSDFGLVKASEPDPTFMTAGTTVGTPHYMAPEQARGQALDIRADLYALGATLYHSVTGRTPFAGSSASLLMNQHLTKSMPPPESINPALTPGCAAIIKKLLAKDRQLRYANPAEALEDVLRHLRGEPPLALSAQPRAGPRANPPGHGQDGPAAARPGVVPPGAPAPARVRAAHGQAQGSGATSSRPRGGQWPAQWPLLMITAAMSMLAGMLLMAALLTNSARQPVRLELGGSAGDAANAAAAAQAAQPAPAAPAAPAATSNAGHGTGKPLIGTH